MSRSVPDILRSLKWYLSLYLPDDFDVRTGREGGTFERPLAVVRNVGNALYSPRGKNITEITQPFTIYVWPDSDDDPELAEDEAWARYRDVERAFVRGDLSQGAGRAGHRRIPIFSYEGLSVKEVPTDFDFSQTLTLPAGTNAGTFDVSFAGQTAAEIPYNASDSALQAALESLSSIGAGNVEVSGTNPWTVKFVNDLGGVVHGGLLVDGSKLLPGPNITVDVETVGARGTEGHARVVDFSIQNVPDPEDDALFTITAQVRVTWLAPAERQTYQKIVGQVKHDWSQD